LREHYHVTDVFADLVIRVVKAKVPRQTLVRNALANRERILAQARDGDGV
jgi:hypothetical protein